MIEIRWHGRGGQGAFTASKILGAAAVYSGKYALAFPSFGPERRGAPIQAFTKISEDEIKDRSVIIKCDSIVFLDDTLYTSDALNDLKEGGKVLINTKTPEKFANQNIVTIDADAISTKILQRPVSNTAMLALLVTDLGIVSKEKIKEVLHLYLSEKIARKNEEIIEYIASWKGSERSRS